MISATLVSVMFGCKTNVLVRKMLLAAISAPVPMSYAPIINTTLTVIMGTAPAAYAYAKPYVNDTLNQLGMLALFASFIAMAVTVYVAGDAWSQSEQ